MKRMIILVVSALSVTLFTGCFSDGIKDVRSMPGFISEEFTSDDTYMIVCRGYPKPGLTGLSKKESAQEGALLTAHAFIIYKFEDTVKPDVDGEVIKYIIEDDAAVIYFQIRKKNIKKYLKRQ